MPSKKKKAGAGSRAGSRKKLTGKKAEAAVLPVPEEQAEEGQANEGQRPNATTHPEVK